MFTALTAVNIWPYRRARSSRRWLADEHYEGGAEFVDAVVKCGPGPAGALGPDPHQVTVPMFTSGITGERKGVMNTHNTLMAAIRPWAERFGLDSDGVVHVGSTLCHLTGFLYGAWLPTHLAATR